MANRAERAGAGTDQITRRHVLASAAAAAASGAIAAPATMAAELPTTAPAGGRIKQSVISWCFAKYWDVEQMCQVAARLGLKSVELIDPKHWPVLKKHGLCCAIAGSHGFVKGMNNPKYRDEVMGKLRTSIDAAASAGFDGMTPSVITFTGMREDLTDEAGAKYCVEGFKEIVRYAEQMKVTLCLEHLNSRDPAEMKGHPGYQGDHIEYCIDILRRVGSERMKLLFDIYHVQIMDGDVIRRIRQHHEYIGHVHTAGNPGRGELDDKQEINYPPIMRALIEVGYKGYVGQEFIPTRDPLAGLAEAVRLCDV